MSKFKKKTKQIKKKSKLKKSKIKKKHQKIKQSPPRFEPGKNGTGGSRLIQWDASIAYQVIKFTIYKVLP